MKKLLAAFLLSFFALYTIMIGSVGFAQQGVTDDEILIGSWGPQSGPAAAWGTVNVAIDAYFQYINDQGGINGRNLVLVSRDDGYDPARSVGAARELNDREKVFAFVGGIGTATGLAVMPIVQRGKIPWVSPASGSGAFADQSNGLVFATFTDYAVESALMTRHAVETLGNKKIAIFYQNDGYGGEGLAGLEGEIARLQEAGVEVELEEINKVSYERGETNMAVQALRFKAGGADAVIMYSTPTAAASLLGEFQKIEYAPRILASTTLLDPTLLANPGMQGALLSTFLRLPTVIVGEGNGDPIADAAFMDIVVAYAPEAAKDPFRSLAGIAFAQPLVEALKMVGDDLTRESLIDALNSIEGYSEGLFTNLDFTNGPQGNNSIMLLQMTPTGLRPAIDDFITFE